jgi:hypothetical protein
VTVVLAVFAVRGALKRSRDEHVDVAKGST